MINLPNHLGLTATYAMQVCLAAEECGHLDFDNRTDMWWSAEAFHCGDTPRGSPHFLDIVLKVALCLGIRPVPQPVDVRCYRPVCSYT